jgi:hypothetical protein
MRNALGLTLVALAFLWRVDAVAGQPDVRLRQLDAVNSLFAAGQGRLIAGQRVLYANPEALFAWPISGGSYRRIALLPDLGEALNSLTEGGGFVRVEAIAGDRVVVARGEGSALSFTPDSGPGHHLRVGPATGPFVDPAGCRERSGRPAALSGDLLAYVAAPARKPACPPGVAPAVGGPAILVRDLGSGGAVRARLPLPYDGAVDQLALQGQLLAYSLAVRPFDADLEREPASSLHVVDLASGSELLRLAPAANRVWALDDGGGVVTARARLGRRPRGACVGRLQDLRQYLPGMPAGAPLPFTPCGHSLALDGGLLRFSVPRADGRAAVLEHRLADGATRQLATVAGELADSSASHLLVRDTTCTSDDLRVIALSGELPALPAGPLRCPVVVRAQRRVRAGNRFRMVVRCPRGCIAHYTLAIPHARSEWTSYYEGDLRLQPRRRRVLHRRIASGTARKGRTTGVLTVTVRNPADQPTTLKRRVVVLPPRRAMAPSAG